MERLETGWETTISLLEQGMKEGVIRPVKIPIVKMMLEAALEQFFQRDILISNGISYQALVVLDKPAGLTSEGHTRCPAPAVGQAGCIRWGHPPAGRRRFGADGLCQNTQTQRL